MNRQAPINLHPGEDEKAFWRRIKEAIRQKFAWPGSYELFIVMGDGELMCMDCARKEYGRIRRDMRDGYDSSFCVSDATPYWEGPALECCHCNEPIYSAYGNPWRESEELCEWCEAADEQHRAGCPNIREVEGNEIRVVE